MPRPRRSSTRLPLDTWPLLLVAAGLLSMFVDPPKS